jgi:hypothetical protein
MKKHFCVLRVMVALVCVGLALALPVTVLAAGEGPGGVDNTKNLVLWLKADAGVTLNGTTVSTWDDQSGRNNHVTQGTPGHQPIYLAGALNDRPVLRFDGIDDLLAGASMTAFDFGEEDLSWFMVARPNDSSVRKTVFGTLNAQDYNSRSRGIAGGFDANEYPYAWYRNMGITQDTSADGLWVIIGTRRVDGYASLYRNSVEVVDATLAEGNVDSDALCVGCAGITANNRFFSGDIAEIIIFDTAVSTAERILIENYLSAKYGIPLAINDIYAGDTYGFNLDVAGVGLTLDGLNPTAHSAGMNITNQGFLQDYGDYIVIGHKEPTNGTTPNDCPAGVDYRWTREWYLSKTDVGTQHGMVEIVFDFSESGFGGEPSGGYTLLKRSSAGTEDFYGVATSDHLHEDQVIFNVDASILGSDFTLGHNNPTAVELARFEVESEADGVLVTWETASELDNVGFNLYRAEASEGPYTQLNTTLIPPQMPGSVMGAVYTWLDEDANPLVAHYYVLEDVDVKGVVTSHGPVASVVVAAPTAVGPVTLRGAGSLALLALVMMGAVVVLRRR